jgi:hypothetical protein
MSHWLPVAASGFHVGKRGSLTEFFYLHRQDARQFFSCALIVQMRVLLIFWRHRKAPVVIRNETGQSGVGAIHVGYARQTHFFGYPVPQGLVKILVI